MDGFESLRCFAKVYLTVRPVVVLKVLTEDFLDIYVPTHRCGAEVLIAHEYDDVDGGLGLEMVESLQLNGGEVGGWCMSCVDEVAFEEDASLKGVDDVLEFKGAGGGLVF